MPTHRQKLVFEKVTKEGKSVSRAMREVGYPEKTTAKNPQAMTKSKAWEQMMSEYISEEFVASKHQDLMNAKRIDYFVFPKTMPDEEIIAHVASVGITVITVRESDKGKMAFYSTDDTNAIKSGIDMAYKLKGRYKDGDNKPSNNYDVKQIIIVAPNGESTNNNQAIAEAVRSLSSVSE